MADQNQHRDHSGHNPASNLSEEDRRKGGQNSAREQEHDQEGQFSGQSDNQ